MTLAFLLAASGGRVKISNVQLGRQGVYNAALELP